MDDKQFEFSLQLVMLSGMDFREVKHFLDLFFDFFFFIIKIKMSKEI